MLKIEHSEVMGWEHVVRGMHNPLNSWDKSDSGLCKGGDNGIGCSNCASHDCQHSFDGEFKIGKADHALMTSLRDAGTDHRKFMRMIVVYLDITAPLYWWKEFDTYKVGTVANSCSTMHKIAAKEFTLDDFSYEQLSCWGAATRGNDPTLVAKDKCGLMNEKVSEFTFDYMGCLMATIVALNGAREQYLKRLDKAYWWQMIQLLPTSYNQKRTVLLNYEVLANIYKSRRNHKLVEWHIFCDWVESLPHSELITGKAT